MVELQKANGIVDALVGRADARFPAKDRVQGNYQACAGTRHLRDTETPDAVWLSSGDPLVLCQLLRKGLEAAQHHLDGDGHQHQAHQSLHRHNQACTDDALNALG